MSLGTTVGSIAANVSAATLADTLFVRGPDGGAHRIIGGGGSSTYAALTDVLASSVADGQVAQYSAASSKWVMVSPLSLSLAVVITSDDGSALLTDGTNPLSFQQNVHVLP